MKLFIKIFLWFLAATALMIGVIIFVTRTFQTDPMVSRGQRSTRNQMMIYSGTANQIVDIKAKLRAVGIVDVGGDLERRLLIGGGGEYSLAGDLGRYAVDQKIALGVERLIGRLERQRKALHVELPADFAEAAIADLGLAFEGHGVGIDARNQGQFQLELAIDLAIDGFGKRRGFAYRLDRHGFENIEKGSERGRDRAAAMMSGS